MKSEKKMKTGLLSKGAVRVYVNDEDIELLEKGKIVFKTLRNGWLCGLKAR